MQWVTACCLVEKWGANKKPSVWKRFKTPAKAPKSWHGRTSYETKSKWSWLAYPGRQSTWQRSPGNTVRIHKKKWLLVPAGIVVPVVAGGKLNLWNAKRSWAYLVKRHRNHPANTVAQDGFILLYTNTFRLMVNKETMPEGQEGWRSRNNRNTKKTGVYIEYYLAEAAMRPDSSSEKWGLKP